MSDSVGDAQSLHRAHIGLNATLLSLGENYRAAGIHWYIYHLLTHLPAADPNLRYTAFISDQRFHPPTGLHVQPPAWPTTSAYTRILWEQLAAPLALKKTKIDLLHALAFVSPWATRRPAVVTVLDLSFIHFPSAFKALNRLYLRTMTRISARRAARVIAISEHTRRDVISLLGVPAERVQTIHCGVTPAFRPLPSAEVESFRLKQGLPERFVLFLSTIQPRKNVMRLIKAFDQMLSSGGLEMDDVHLVVAGGKGWFFEPVFALVQDLGLTDRVHFPGYVPEQDKVLWYNAATCFCYPSLYEGFGLPPLEAMACGTPVVTSNAASLPEVVGDAGLMVDPKDVPGLSDALYDLLSDAALRETLSAKGRARAAQFTWEETARQTTQLYRHLLTMS